MVITAAMLVGCRANPGFALFDDGEDRVDTDADTDESDSSSGDIEICEPVASDPADACKPGEGVPLWLFEGFTVARSPMLVDVPCGQLSQILVKRVGDDLQRCNDGCDAACEPQLHIDVSLPASIALFAPLLPAPGECARLWHIGQPSPEKTAGDACVTAGFALLDDTPDPRLRVAVAFNTADPNPLSAVTDSPFAAVVSDAVVGDGLCPGVQRTACDESGAVPKQLDFRIEDCPFASYQGQVVDVRARGGPYTLENHSGYDCVNGPTVYRWWIRRGD